MKFAIITFGCKVNSYESEYIKEQLLLDGYKETDFKTSDIVIVNTCSVTNIADNKCKKMIRSIKRENPKAILVVCGCSVENNKDYYNDLDIDILLGNKDKAKIVELIKSYLDTREKYVEFNETRFLPFEDMKVTDFNDLTRAYVKIQDGCDNFCAYCIIPYVRGSVRSKDFDKVIEECKELVSKGHKEIVLTGIDTGAYGRDTKTHNLTDLIRELSKIDGLDRIRISSIEIMTLGDEFINELANNKKLCGHLHISLQSGSDKILKLMNRKYTKDEYYKKVVELRKARPDINLTTDVIVGFPGETEEDFNECIEFCKKVKFSKIHVFPYSVRTGTKAATMDNQLSQAVKKERARKLIKIDEDLQLEYNKKFVGKEIELLVEENDGKSSFGHTENFLKVEIKKVLENNTYCKVIVKEAFVDRVIGNIL